MVEAALNEAQDVFVLLTLCLEKTATLTITANENFITPMSTAADWFVPLRVRLFVGAKLYPGTIDDFRAEAVDWQAERGTPRKYAVMGCNLLAVYPAPSTSGSAIATYAYAPTRLASNGDVPEIPEEDHPALSEYAEWRCQLAAGGADLAAAGARLRSFLDAAAKRAGLVRARNMAQGYDRLPPEITQADISRIVKEATNGPSGSRQRRGNPVAARG